MGENLQPGDIFLTRGTGFVSKAIRFFTRRVGESRTKVNHVGIVVQGGPLETAVVVEALRRVERHRLIDEYGGTKHEVAVYRPTRVSPADIDRIVARANGYVGREYGYGKIVLHALDWALQGAYVFRRLGRMDDYPVCSWLVAQAYASVGIHFGVDEGAATPDDIWDHVTAHPGEYARVRALATLTRAVPVTAPARPVGRPIAVDAPPPVRPSPSGSRDSAHRTRT